MLTGHSTFQGETSTEILAAVIMKEPDLSELPRRLSPQLRQMLARSLTKDPKQRLRDIGEARIAISEALANPDSDASDQLPAGTRPSPSPVWRKVAPWAITLLACLGIGAAFWRPAAKTASPNVRFLVGLPSGTTAVSDDQVSVAISADGQQIAFVAKANGRQQIYTRRMDSTDAVPVTGTEDGTGPFFSPDGQWLGFVGGGKLKKIRLSGGSPMTLADVPNPRGATWLADDSIVFAPGAVGGLVRITASGSTQELTHLQPSSNERTHRWPFALPGGKAVLFTVGNLASIEDYDGSEIDAVVIATGERKTIFRGARMAQYFPSSGHLLLSREGSLFAVPFDPERLTVSGNPVLMLQGVLGEKTTGASNLAVSDTGTLFFIPGVDKATERLLGWLDATGTPVLLPAPPRQYQEPVLSPDGQLVAVTISNGSSRDIWVYDISRKTLNRLTFGEGSNSTPVWSGDGRRIIYRKDNGVGKIAIAWKAADGSGDEEILFTGDRSLYPSAASPDGKWLALSLQEKGNAYDIYILGLAGDHKLQPYVTGPYDESGASFSPDGRWIAYRSNESGRYEIYVKPFPDPKGRWQVSTEGGGEARWSATAKEIIYRRESQYMAVPVETAGTFRAGQPRLFLNQNLPRITAASSAVFTLSHDGKRILVVVPPQAASSGIQLEVTTNWTEELLHATAAQK